VVGISIHQLLKNLGRGTEGGMGGGIIIKVCYTRLNIITIVLQIFLKSKTLLTDHFYIYIHYVGLFVFLIILYSTPASRSFQSKNYLENKTLLQTLNFVLKQDN